MKHLSSLILISALVSPVTFSAEGSFEHEIAARQAAFTQIDESSELIEDELDSKSVDWQLLEKSSAEVVTASSSLPELFPAGSHDNSKAKEKIWDNTTKFNAALAKMDGQFLALQNAVQRKDRDAAEVALEQATSTCNGCHRKYRSLW